MPLETPVLFLIFNRPEPTRQVFERIRAAKPQKLFVAADGPRPHKPDDARKCAETREIIKLVDWDCEVKVLFREENYGCQKAVSGAISWFFEHVEEGIIIEDDCLPALAFFDFCERLLAKYRHDTRVMQICGNKFLSQRYGDGDYFFSLIPHIWGWATWRRAWQLADIPMKTWPAFRDGGYLKEQFADQRYRQRWKGYFEDTYQKKIDSWGWPWTYTVISNHGLSICPNENLVSNIGFGQDATHTIDSNDLANVPAQEVKLDKDPTFVFPAPGLIPPLMEHLYFVWDPPFHRRVINRTKAAMVNMGLISNEFTFRKKK